MPNPPVHINLARQVARRLGHETLEANLDYFLLGSTSPDVRVITRMDREHYHFAPLDFEQIGAGVRGLFESHPQLMSSADYSGPTQAFVAGYITHILADESWIVNMFRPYFGNPEVFEDDVLGKVMDRAMQLEMDRRCWETVGSLRTLLEPPVDSIDIGFIAPDTLADWSQWVLASLDRGFSWERLRFMARRIAAGDEAHPAHHVAEEFVRNVPESLERLYRTVPRERVEGYNEATVEHLARAVEDYLP